MNEHDAAIGDDEKHARADIGDTDAQPFGSAAPNLDSEIKVRSRHVWTRGAPSVSAQIIQCYRSIRV